MSCRLPIHVRNPLQGKVIDISASYLSSGDLVIYIVAKSVSCTCDFMYGVR